MLEICVEECPEDAYGGSRPYNIIVTGDIILDRFLKGTHRFVLGNLFAVKT